MQNKSSEYQWEIGLKITCLTLLFFILSPPAIHRCLSRQHEVCTLRLYTAEQEDTVRHPYTEIQLEMFLDSIGALPTDSLMEEVTHYYDSVFYKKPMTPRTIADSDLVKLKAALVAKDHWEKRLDLNTLKRMTDNPELDSTDIAYGSVPVIWYSFDSRVTDFHEYAVCIGPFASWHCTVLFVQDNQIIAEHRIEHHYGLEMDHFKDKQGKNVIYYKENFGTGTGIWQFNTFFYRFEKGQLIPVLNLLENGNLQDGWSYRDFWLESEMVKKRPMKFRMNYYQELEDSSGIKIRLIEGKTTVTYTWDENLLKYHLNMENQDITQAQMLTYYLADNEILFIHAYHDMLKNALGDPTKKGAVLEYLSKIKQTESVIPLKE
jgi:hypothetical protein